MSTMLRPPSLGPIVGHTTSQSARLWIRGAEAGDGRTVGVRALYSGNDYVPGSAEYFRLRREYDRTGTTELKGLAPDTTYTARLGSMMLDNTEPLVAASDEDLFTKLPPPEAFRQELERLPPAESVAVFRTFPEAPGPLSFIFGSCRYPGLLWQRKRADQIFGAIQQRFVNPDGETVPRFLLMAGDQIYADMLNRAIPLARADTEAEFRNRYVDAFGAPNTRATLRTTPTYMILDDHEIEDNWVQGRIRHEDKRFLFNTAITAYVNYQWSHGPRTFGKLLYYTFECMGHPFFVMDGRTQRMRFDDDEDVNDNHLLGYPAQQHHEPAYHGQIDVLCEWLVQQQKEKGNVPKFLVSASVFAPNTVESVRDDRKWKDDGWAAFPLTRRQLLETIVDHSVQNVFILSGDIHVSCFATLSFENEGKELPLKAYAITSSAFYWPFPFADGNPLGYVHDSRLEKDDFVVREGLVMKYRATAFQQEDNFTQVDVTGAGVTLRNFDKRNNLLGKAQVLPIAAP